jgi:hypothetical protein
MDAASTEMAPKMSFFASKKISAHEERLVFGIGWRHLVYAGLLLHNGRIVDGAQQILQLDAAHGQHDYLQTLWGVALNGGVSIRTRALVFLNCWHS